MSIHPQATSFSSLLFRLAVPFFTHAKSGRVYHRKTKSFLEIGKALGDALIQLMGGPT